MAVLLRSAEFRELLQEALTFVVALLGMRVGGFEQAWRLSEADEAASLGREDGERERERERLDREYALGAGYEAGEVPAGAWPGD